MDVLKSMTVFAAVARHRGFAGAARALGMSTSSVSRQVIALEHWLGVSLFERTTRRLALTEEGNRYLGDCQKIIDDVAGIQETAKATLVEPSGSLRVTAPVFLAKECLVKVLPGFLHDHPKVTVQLAAIDRFVDLVGEGFDLALRVGNLADSTLQARKLGDIRLVVVASAEYLSAHGSPQHADALAEHNCIVDEVASFSNRWPIHSVGRRKRTPVAGNIAVNNGEVARDLAMAGIGLALLPEFFVLDQLCSGALVEVLPGQVDANIGLFAVYPQTRHQKPRVRAFIDVIDRYYREKVNATGAARGA